MRIRSVRGRATVIAAVTVAVVFGVGSWITVRGLQRSLRSDISAENEEVLDELAAQIESGANPRTLGIPFGSDGTEFLVLDADQQLLNSSFLGSPMGVGPPIVVEGEVGAVGFVQGSSVALTESELQQLDTLLQNDLTDEEAAQLAEILAAGPILGEPIVGEPVVSGTNVGAATVDVLPPGLEGSVLVAGGGVILIERDDWLETRRSVTNAAGEPLTLVGLSPIRIAERNIDRLAWVMIGLVPLLTVLGAAGAWWAAGEALSPVRRITDEANRIAPSNSGNRLPVPDSNDEISTLAATLNEMLDRLDDGLTRQRQFVSDASHELRSPLTAVTGAAGILTNRPGLDDDVARNIGLVARGAQRLESVLDDLTALASGDDSTEHAPVDLADLILAEVATATARGSAVIIDTSKVQALEITASPVQLGRAVANLLDNAVGHAEHRVSIGVHTRTSTDGTETVEIVVDDDGPGVPPDRREVVFERFVRLDDARSRDEGGSGLGLALVASIAAAHSGSVRCDDSPLGGARFVLRLGAT